MNSAGFDTQITVQKKQVTRDPNFNTEVVEWVPLSTIPDTDPPEAEKYWARITDLIARKAEYIQNGVEIAANRSKLEMRWRGDIDSSMQIIVHRDTDETHQIVVGPAMVGRKEGLQMIIEKYSS